LKSGKLPQALAIGLVLMASSSWGAPTKSFPPTPSPEGEAEHVILFVLEGVGQEAVKEGPMPVLGRFVKDGSFTWSASGARGNQRLPTMASLITGLPVEKHGIDWDAFDFARGYPRPPTVFDYLDLSGGKDSAIFFMDESLYQLAKPEPYTDYQICGSLRPECNTTMILKYIRDYFRKATSGHGYGHAILSLPHFLVLHLPQPAAAAQVNGWHSPAYKESLREVDRAMAAVLDVYKDLGLLNKTAVIVTALSGAAPGTKRSAGGDQAGPVPGANGDSSTSAVPWIAWGPGIKGGHLIKQPVSILDTGATVMRTLNLETYTEWDSRPIEEIFRSPRGAPAGEGERGQ
jgi:hypothetical protein